jgi:hypothetical protein
MGSEPKARRTTPVGDVRGDTATFVEFMQKLVAVPHSEIKAQAEVERELTEKYFGVSRVSAAALAKRER